LIISPKLKTSVQKSEILAKIWEMLDFKGPFEIHLINEKEYKNWYRYFIKKKVKV